MSVNKLKESSIPAVEENKKAKSTFREYVEAIGMALILALFIRTFVVQAFKIPSGSMIPTLQIGDHILVNKLAYGIRIPFWNQYLVEFKTPRRADVVVFIFPEDRSKDFIKRVIGVGGDVVEIRGKKVYVNKVVQEDPYARFEGEGALGGELPIRDDYGPTRVPDNHVFVMGDNRDRSYDSRFWGFVDLEDVKGKAFLIYWSWDGTDRWVRWERIGDLIY
ncbi:MAG TPA: signal peptidase I [Candidatus Binatia bacterium]|nr:signal peptidase I [Candidatus Binatia bacterium]